MEEPVAGFIHEGDRIDGVRFASGGEERAAKLVIAADGRSSLVRSLGLLPVETIGAPMDVFWFRLPRSGEPGEALRGSIDSGRMVVLIDQNGQERWRDVTFPFLRPKADTLLAAVKLHLA